MKKLADFYSDLKEIPTKEPAKTSLAELKRIVEEMERRNGGKLS